MKGRGNILLLLILGLLIYSCSKQSGCIDPNASNYIYEAQKDDGSCLYDMSFWMKDVEHLPANIFVNGVFRDSLMCGWISGKPTCGVDTFINTTIGTIKCTVNIPMIPGKHEIRVEGRDGTVWEKSVILGENCISILINGPN